MNETDMFRIAMHNPSVMAMALYKLSYRSQVRATLENELRKAARTPFLAFSYMHPGIFEPKMTVETFAILLERIGTSGMYNGNIPYAFGNVVQWWSRNVNLFSDAQAPIVNSMLQHVEKFFDTQTYIIPLLGMVPETQEFDTVRTKIRELFLTFVEKHQAVRRLLIGNLKSVTLVAQWPMHSKRFKTVSLPDEYRQQMIDLCIGARSEYARYLACAGLQFAIRTEQEFLDYWAKATDSWRIRLAGMYGKISTDLLARMLSKYHQNNKLVNVLLNHPEISVEQLTFFMVRGNKTATDILAKRFASEPGKKD